MKNAALEQPESEGHSQAYAALDKEQRARVDRGIEFVVGKIRHRLGGRNIANAFIRGFVERHYQGLREKIDREHYTEAELAALLVEVWKKSSELLDELFRKED